MKTFYISILFIAFGLAQVKAQIPAASQNGAILILGGTLHKGDGEVLENAAIAFDKGVITLVGNAAQRNIIPTDYKQVIKADGKHIYPGFIASNINIGLTEIDEVRATHDFNETGNFNPNVRSLVSYNTDSKVMYTVRTNGILLAQSCPRGGTISGTSSLFALDGWNWEDAVYKADEGIHLNWPGFYGFNWSEHGRGAMEKNKNHDSQVQEIVKFFDDAKAYCNTKSPAVINLRYESMREIFNGTQNLYLHAAGANEISESILFAKDKSIAKPVLVGGRDAMTVKELIKKQNVPVILERLHSLPASTDRDVDEPYRLASDLTKEGITVALGYEGDMEVMGSRNLPFQAGTSVAYGLNIEEALKLITSNPAKIYGLTKTGTLNEGMDATLFISTGDALDMRTNNVEQAFIRGKNIELKNHQTELYDKYKGKYGF